MAPETQSRSLFRDNRPIRESAFRIFYLTPTPSLPISNVGSLPGRNARRPDIPWDARPKVPLNQGLSGEKPEPPRPAPVPGQPVAQCLLNVLPVVV